LIEDETHGDDLDYGFPAEDVGEYLGDLLEDIIERCQRVTVLVVEESEAQ